MGSHRLFWFVHVRKCVPEVATFQRKKKNAPNIDHRSFWLSVWPVSSRSALDATERTYCTTSWLRRPNRFAQLVFGGVFGQSFFCRNKRRIFIINRLPFHGNSTSRLAGILLRHVGYRFVLIDSSGICPTECVFHRPMQRVVPDDIARNSQRLFCLH